MPASSPPALLAPTSVQNGDLASTGASRLSEECHNDRGSTMKVLRDQKPTKEQLAVITRTEQGVLVVRGAAGSGKTTTALLRLKQTVRFWQARVRSGHLKGPVRVLVLTYNRTLRGYIQELARSDIQGVDVELTVTTFAKWATDHLPDLDLQPTKARKKLWSLVQGQGMDPKFLISEVDYVLGRFEADRLEDYIGCERTGRGTTPRVTQATRRELLDQVVYPYSVWKAKEGIVDWVDLPTLMVEGVPAGRYHVVVVDEAQDFSANQVRAVIEHLADEHSLTFVADGAQRIYPPRFTWAEVGLNVGPTNSRQLTANFRNTRQIAEFAASLLTDVEHTDDAALPDFSQCTSDGPVPLLVTGRFARQVDHLIEFIKSLDPAAEESVALLHPKGGEWFDYLRERLEDAGIAYVELTRQSEWPAGPEQVALSTMHSVKGLEFDHVAVIGLNAETMSHGNTQGHSQLEADLRLLAMAAGRARRTLRITYKADEASDLIGYINPETYERISL